MIDPSPEDRNQLAAALRIQRLSRHRSAVFGQHSDLFRDPAWDMLIEAFIADRKGICVHIKALTCAANVPATTALRWVREIERAGFVIRAQSKQDRRASTIALTELGRRYVAAFLRRSE